MSLKKFLLYSLLCASSSYSVLSGTPSGIPAFASIASQTDPNPQALQMLIDQEYYHRTHSQRTHSPQYFTTQSTNLISSTALTSVAFCPETTDYWIIAALLFAGYTVSREVYREKRKEQIMLSKQNYSRLKSITFSSTAAPTTIDKYTRQHTIYYIESKYTEEIRII